MLILQSTIIFSQEAMAAYRIFNNQNEEVSFQKMANDLSKYDVVFFGELHNNPIAHWFQFELTNKLFDLKEGKLILGAEMFEKDNQLILDEYLHGLIKEKELIEDGKAWNNYKTDYAPLVNFAKENKISFVATNVPRRYASLVSKKGLDSLGLITKDARKNYIAPLPIEVPYENESYVEMEKMMSGHGMTGAAKNFVAAQALKDATMGYSIFSTLKKKNKHKLFLHFNGNFHSKNHEGIVWYVNQYNKKLKVAVISFVEQKEVDVLEVANFGKNEFTIVCKDSMTKTF